MAHTAPWAEFFVAPDDSTASGVKGIGPGRALPSLPVGDYDPADAVGEWEALFAHDGNGPLPRPEPPHEITEITNDGAYVFAVSDRLVTLLTGTDPARRDAVARAWSRQRRQDGEDIGETEATAHLSELADLARRAHSQGEGLYCSVT